MIRPSSLPALAVSPLYVSDPAGNEYADAGTERHAALADLLRNPEATSLVDFLDDAEAEAVRWAAGQVRIYAPTKDHPLRIEETRLIELDGVPMRGTPDVTCGNHLFDFKWRLANYDAQLAGYALMVMAGGYDRVTVYVLFGESRKARIYDLTRAQAEAIVWTVFKGVERASGCNLSDYCLRCLKITHCREHVKRVEAVRAGREDWTLEQYHATEIKTAEEAGKALHLAHAVTKWGAAVKHRAEVMATKEGIVATGFKLAPRNGKKYVADVVAAFSAAGVPQDDFLKCCDVRLNTSATYPDKLGLVEVFGKQNGTKKAEAKRQVEARLAGIIKTGNQTFSLVEEKAITTEDNT